MTEMPMITRHASCSCGQLRIACQGDPVRISICHCLACQKRTGAPFGEQARFAVDQVATDGRTATYKRRGESGGEATFRFCPDCGSTVWWTPNTMVWFVSVAVGAFADPGFPAPTVSVYDEHRHPWTAANPELTRE